MYKMLENMKKQTPVGEIRPVSINMNKKLYYNLLKNYKFDIVIFLWVWYSIFRNVKESL